MELPPKYGVQVRPSLSRVAQHIDVQALGEYKFCDLQSHACDIEQKPKHLNVLICDYEKQERDLNLTILR